MAKDAWIPIGFVLSDGSTIRSLLYSGEEWQIYETNEATNILIIRSGLKERWLEEGFLTDSLFKPIEFSSDVFQCLSSNKKYSLEPVEGGKSPDTKIDALAFAVAIRESRKLSEGSFHDALYIEQYSTLLPTWTSSSYVDDNVVLGTWLTGGVVVSTGSFRRLNNLTGWMPVDDLLDVIKAAGLSTPVDAGLLAKQKPSPKVDDAHLDEKVNKGQPQAHDHVVETGSFSLPGRPHLENFFNDHVVDILVNSERYQALGIDFPSAIILHGPPGCGKTFAVEKLVEFINWPSYSIDSNSVGSPYIHETSKKISEVFDTAIDNAPSIVMIDEMESFLADRRSGGTSGLHHIEEVAEFLRRIPEAIKNRVLIVAMTNLIEMIDPAILRRGRFDHIIEVGMPSKEEVTSLLDSLLSNIPSVGDLDLEGVIDALTGKPLSDAAFVIREAARLAAKAGKNQLDQDSINAALGCLPNALDEDTKRIGFVQD
ncbi:ATP-binding protein [uncultured Pseudodesulfovibrio sp.]|uniref:ATP-binding protein n=1 Tax=uncultured Pseudodesulfovibrio sp. TaxID=2035858 RepID=UPI0029C90471|nr:ATP-binding protein [uncultured Pseudodesulfovibrio sp.]